MSGKLGSSEPFLQARNKTCGILRFSALGAFLGTLQVSFHHSQFTGNLEYRLNAKHTLHASLKKYTQGGRRQNDADDENDDDDDDGETSGQTAQHAVTYLLHLIILRIFFFKN